MNVVDIPSPPRKVNTRELRQSFINRIGEFLIEQYADVIQGKGEFVGNDPQARKDAWEVLKSMLLGTQEAEKITASNAADVLKLLKDGAISIADAKELMHIISAKHEMDELSELAKKLEEMSTPGASNAA